MGEIVLPEDGYAIMGACFEVHNTLGAGFLEAVYEEALGLEFGTRGIPFDRQPQLHLFYKGTRLAQVYQPDFICFGRVIVELKAIQGLLAVHRAQTMNYLRSTQLRLAYLVNFNSHPKLEYERIVL